MAYVNRRNRIAHLLTALALSAWMLNPGSAAAQATRPPTYAGVVFATAAADDPGSPPIPLRMNIWLPTNPQGPTPMVLFVHGGGWTTGTYQNPPLPATLSLLDAGVAVATLDYRLSQQAIFPAQIHDVKGAVRYLRASSSLYNLDPSRFGVWGPSAGGHLAALLACSGGLPELEGDTGGNLGFSSAVTVAVDYYGPTDIINMTPDVTNPPGSTSNHDLPTSAESMLIGFDQPGQGIGVLRASPELYPVQYALATSLSPVTHVGADDPPIFIAHGTNDTTVPLRQSRRLFEALSAAGVPTTFIEVQGAGHGPLGATADGAAVNFLLLHLLDNDGCCPGDANRSRAVNFDDVTTVLGNLGRSGGGPGSQNPGDADCSGTVNFDDVTTVLGNFGAACP